MYLAGSWVAYQVIMAITQGVGLPAWVPAFSLVLFLVGLPLMVATAIVQEGHPFEGRSEDRNEGEVSLTESPGAGGARGADPGGGGPARAAGIVRPADELLRPPRPPGGPPVEAGPLVTGTTAPASTPRSGLTWRRVLVLGAAAFLSLGLGTAGFMGLRAAGIGPAGTLLGAGEVRAGDLLVLADFANATPDPVLSDVVTRALRVDLHQGRVAGIADPARVREAVGRMGRDPEAPLTESMALEVAEREGLAGVISGEVAPVGAGFSLASQIVATDGRVLAMFRETARSPDDLVDAIERLSRGMRARLGDSYRELYATPPLARVTTGSLEALRLFTEAERIAASQGFSPQAVELWEEAVAVDPEFAMAHRRLGVAYSGVLKARSREAFRRAYELRDRLTPTERGLAEGDYLRNLAGDYPRAIQAYRAALRANPDNDIARNNLMVALTVVGDYDEAEAQALEGLAREPADAAGSLRRNLVYLRFDRGDFEGVSEILQEEPESFGVLVRPGVTASMALDLREWEPVADLLEPHLGPGAPPPASPDLADLLISYRLATGRHEDNLAFGRALLASLPPEAVPVNEAIILLVLEATAAERPALALDFFRWVFREFPFDARPPEDRPWEMHARTLARAGDLDGAQAALETFERHTPAWAVAERREARTAVAEVALAEGRPEAALALLRESHPDPRWPRLTAALRGRIFDALAQPDSAVVWWATFVEDRSSGSRVGAERELGTVLPRLADLHEAAGNAARARELRLEYLRMRPDPDPALRPRMEAVRRQVGADEGDR